MDAFQTGAIFGGALTASGVFNPAVILTQLKWDNYHMLQVFLTATATSSIIATTAQKLGVARLPPRSYADRGWFAPYDGNLVGGLALGAGMALSNACPGTVLAQSALNIRSGYYALGGGLLGGLAWAAWLRPLVARPKREQPAQGAASAATDAAATDAAATVPPPLSLTAVTGLPANVVLAAFVAVCAACVAGSTILYGSGPYVTLPPVLGGLAIGFAQLFSVLRRKQTLGVSTMYEDVGDWLVWYAAPALAAGAGTGQEKPSEKPSKKPPPVNSILFSLGIVTGTILTVRLFPSLVNAQSLADSRVPPMQAVLGGFVMALGSRIAGGCTSGHGISGTALFSTASFITMAAAFLGGSLTARFL